MPGLAVPARAALGHSSDLAGTIHLDSDLRSGCGGGAVSTATSATEACDVPGSSAVTVRDSGL